MAIGRRFVRVFPPFYHQFLVMVGSATVSGAARKNCPDKKGTNWRRILCRVVCREQTRQMGSYIIRQLRIRHDLVTRRIVNSGGQIIVLAGGEYAVAGFRRPLFVCCL